MRPAGLAQILRGGLAVWLQTAHQLPAALWPDHAIRQAVPSDCTPLPTLIAAMIAEVFP